MSSSSKSNPLSKYSKSSRLPPPSLFQGPPSHNASATSLSAGLFPSVHAAAIGSPAGPSSASQRNPLLRQISQRNTERLTTSTPGEPATKDTLAVPNVASSQLSRPPTRQVQRDATADDLRADSLWVEMQNTLADVELSAANGAHVFSAEHARALDELRTAQLALAQAWSRSEAEEAAEKEDIETGGKVGKGAGLLGSGDMAAHSKTGPAGVAEEKESTLEQETEKDIKMARKRREANDRYFSRVNNGVLDVVAKLDDVAAAMSAVEQESREIWSETDSLGTTASAATG